MEEIRNEGKVIIDKGISYDKIWDEIIEDANHNDLRPGDMTIADLVKRLGKSRKTVLKIMRAQEAKGNIIIVRKVFVDGLCKTIFRPIKKGV
jgi:DNA-binding FadR family transcriptional regulator